MFPGDEETRDGPDWSVVDRSQNSGSAEDREVLARTDGTPANRPIIGMSQNTWSRTGVYDFPECVSVPLPLLTFIF